MVTRTVPAITYQKNAPKQFQIRHTRTSVTFKCATLCRHLLTTLFFVFPRSPEGVSYPADARCRRLPRSSAGTCRHLQRSAQEEKENGAGWDLEAGSHRGAPRCFSRHSPSEGRAGETEQKHLLSNDFQTKLNFYSQASGSRSSEPRGFPTFATAGDVLHVVVLSDCCVVNGGGSNLLDGLALGDLRVSDHLVGGADLDEGELGILGDLGSQGRFPAVGRA